MNTVVKMNPREAQVDRDEERKILKRFNHGEITQYATAMALAKLGHSISDAWRIARSAT